MHLPTGLVLIGSSTFAGISAIALFVLLDRLAQRNKQSHGIEFFHDMSYERLQNLTHDIKHVKIVKRHKKKPLLNYHTKMQNKLSHVEIHHKNGTVSKINPKDEHEREHLHNKIRILQSKLAYHNLPNIVTETNFH